LEKTYVHKEDDLINAKKKEEIEENKQLRNRGRNPRRPGKGKSPFTERKRRLHREREGKITLEVS